MSRTRTRESISSVGTYVNEGPYGTSTKGPQLTSRSVCTDDVGKGSDHPLLIAKWKWLDEGRLNGGIEPGTFWGATYHNWRPGGLQDIPTASHLDIPGLMTAEEAATATLARTNPNRPAVDLPLAIAELKDLPGMAKDIGNWFIRKHKLKDNLKGHFGSAYLSGAFGFAPLLSDTLGLLDFQSQASKRANELERLYSKGGLRRRITLGEGRRGGFPVVEYINSVPHTFVCVQTKETQFKQWATVRWKPTALAPKLENREQYLSAARGLVLGLSDTMSSARNDMWSDISDLWNLLPWSWMADWFGNVGDFINAHRNTLPVESSSKVNVMTHRTTLIRGTRIDNYRTIVTGGNYVGQYETKERSLSGASLTASLPFLSGKQLSILGALGMQRLRSK